MNMYKRNLALKLLGTIIVLKEPLNDEALQGMLSLLVEQAEALALANLSQDERKEA